MKVNRGKDFENVIKQSIEKVDGTFIVRLPDPVNGYLGIRNISDFLVYKYPFLYILECKSVHGNTLSIHSNNPDKMYGQITNNQWNGMYEAQKRNGVIAGVICWWIDHDVTRFIPITTLKNLQEQGYKSLRYDMFEKLDHDESVPILGKKKRVFFDYDMEEFFTHQKKDTKTN